MSFSSNKSDSVAVIGLQWGDEGKGKVVDYLADKFDCVIRFQGGHNAGHTIKVNEKVYKLSLMPSGIIRGKLSIIGSGVVVDPIALKAEMDKIKENGISITKDNLIIADNVTLILSVHRELDQLLEERKGGLKIGTTGRGIGPAYEDQVGRRAIRACDISDSSLLESKIESLIFYHNLLRKGLSAEPVSKESLLQEINSFKDYLLEFTSSPFEIYKKVAQKSVMFEGAQGALLDVNYGTFPFVTSSNTIAGQAGIGSCLGYKSIDRTIGIIKAYTTRVGSGPFPTELDNEIGEFIRQEGQEFGTVTGRNRRCGWFDAALVKQSIQLSSVEEVALMKLDVLDKLSSLKICTGYKVGEKIFDHFPSSSNLWDQIEPIYEEMEGWNESTFGVKNFDDLPLKARNYIRRIEELCNVKVVLISTGPERKETILLDF